MKCPKCNSTSVPKLTKAQADRTIRTRECMKCGLRFNTVEIYYALGGQIGIDGADYEAPKKK